MIEYEAVRNILNYDKLTGEFTLKIKHSRNVKVGTIAGSVRPNKYRAIRINYRLYFEHRLAWLWMTGKWPENEIDHINRDRSDNRWSNLREATSFQNQHNTCKPVTNKSGFKGVHWYARKRKFQAQIRVNGRRLHLGYFDTPEKAAVAYRSASMLYVGGHSHAE